MEMCTEWLWARTRGGYGVTTVNSKYELVHRVAYCEFNNLPLSYIKGLVVRHSCDNRGCCNPLHLMLGSQADNMRDKSDRGRSYKPTGELHGMAKLSNSTVWKIRQEYTGERGNQAHLSRKYNLPRGVISNIVNFKSWRI